MKNNTFIEKIYTKKSINKINKKIKFLGINSEINAMEFLNIRLLISILIFIGILYFSSYGFIYAPIITILFYFGIEYFTIDYKIKLRIRKLDKDALFFFEILTLSLESGKNLKGALDLTVRSIKNDISDEFNIVLEEVRYGKSLDEALSNMKERIPSDTINNVILNITQSSIFGSSIVNTLHNQVEYIRDKRFLETKAIINKMPMKISVISVVIFIPIMLLLLLGPILIDFIS